MRPGLRKIIKITSAVFALLIILALSLAYLQYQELKKTFLSRISGRATSFIGQEVEIRDMAFSPWLGINLRDIIVKNPRGFPPGELLKIENLYLSMKYREFIKGKLFFEKIIVHEPQLSVVQDKDGRINISDTLMDFFKRKPGFRYQIDEFTIRSGSVDFVRTGVDGVPATIFRSESVNFRIKDQSSDPGVKTLFEGETSYAGNILKIHGWIYMKDEPKRLNVSISSKDMTLASIKEILGRYGMDAEKTKITFELNAEGDTERGINLRSKADLKKAGFSFFREKATDIRLDMQAFLNIRENALFVRGISLEAGSVNAATLTGEIRKSKEDMYYAAYVEIRKLDLSSLNFLKGVKISGIMTSEDLHVSGNVKKRSPEISGVMRLRGGVFRSDSTDIRGIDAELIFAPGREISLSSKANAKISKVYGCPFEKPASAVLGLTAKGDLKKMDLTSSLNLTRVEITAKCGRSASLDDIAFYLDSTLKDRTFAGDVRIEANGFKQDKYRSPWLRAKSYIAYNMNVITLKTAVIEEKDFRITADRIGIGPLKNRGKKISVAIKDLSASYPAKKAGIRNADLSLNIVRTRDIITGDFGFSAGGIEFNGFPAGLIEGSGAFDDRNFTLNIPKAGISGGSLKLGVQGRTAGGPFPITIASKAENIDLGKFPEEALRTAGMSYGMSGNLKRADIEGTVQSPEAMQGNAIIHAENLSLLDKGKRHIVKDASLTGNILFKGKDLDFKAGVKAGGVAASSSGTVKEFARKGRAGEMIISLPEVKLADIREAFWEIFPDGLLYAGIDGSFSSDLSVRFRDSTVLASGKVTLRDIILTGENGEYSVGPITGIVPLAYSRNVGKQETVKLPSFERDEFENLHRYYSRMKMDASYSKISIGSVSYGFRFLEDVDLWIRQDGQSLNVGWFSGRISGGRLNGSATVELADGLQYRAGFILEGLSLAQLCDSIEPIKGYISGKVNGIAMLKGTGTSLADLMGKAEFWTYATRHEKTKISREFLRKVGGPSVMMYLGDRNFDRGVMDLYLQNGSVVFRELEISNRNLFGVKDLDIKVAPLNNRIALDHLMWSITEAAYRAKKKE